MQLKISRNKTKEIISEWATKLGIGDVDDISFGCYSSSDVEINFVTEDTKKRDADRAAARARYEESQAPTEDVPNPPINADNEIPL